MTPGLTGLSAVELSELCRRGDCSPVEAVEAVLDRIEASGDHCQAFITVAAEQARAAATALTKSRAPLGPLFGVPISVKDLTPTAGIRTTRGSLAHQHRVPLRSAVAVQRLQSAGAVVVGKTTTSEGGWKAEAGNLLVGPTRNPWAPELTAGGSSGGAAAAVALGYGPLATGTDGAGSIRIPASFCGVVGLKPSFGLIPYDPVSVEGLSHFGPLARTVADIALALDVLAGADEHDPTSWGQSWAERDTRLTQAIERAPAPLRIAVIDSVDGYPVDPEVDAALRDAGELLAGLGHRLEPVTWPLGGYRCVSVIMAAHAAAEDDRRDPRIAREDGLARLIGRGQLLSAADLASAEQYRAEYREHVRETLSGYDMALLPTVPVLPFIAGADGPPEVATDPSRWLAWASFCYPANLTGYPAISLPLQVSAGGLPIGIQLMGRWRQDALVLRLARQLELATPWTDRLAELRPTPEGLRHGS